MTWPRCCASGWRQSPRTPGPSWKRSGERQREMSERLIGTYRTVLERLDPAAPRRAPGEGRPARWPPWRRPAGSPRSSPTSRRCRRFTATTTMLLVARIFRQDRATMFALSGLELEATSVDRSVLDALEHALAYSHLTRDYIPDHLEGVPCVDLSFASEKWRRASATATIRGALSAATSRRACSPTSPRSCAPATSRCRRPRSTRTGAAPAAAWEECAAAARRVLRRGRPARPPRRRSPTRCARKLAVRPPRSTPATPTTPTW